MTAVICPFVVPFRKIARLAANFVEADGNPTFESGFNKTITGLTPGKTYTLSFYQAASQQVGFANGLATTERWIVSLGTAGRIFMASRISYLPL